MSEIKTNRTFVFRGDDFHANVHD